MDLISEIGIFSDIKDKNINLLGQELELIIKGAGSKIKDKPGKKHEDLDHK